MILDLDLSNKVDELMELQTEIEIAQMNIHYIRNDDPFVHKDLLHAIDKWSSVIRKYNKLLREFEEYI